MEFLEIGDDVRTSLRVVEPEKHFCTGNESAGVGVWTDLLTAVEGSTKCWDIAYTPSSKGGSWGSYFYFGGPGGKVCN